MSNPTVTLAQIRKHKPCRESWVRLLRATKRDQPDRGMSYAVSIGYLLDLLGLRDALWAFRALDDQQWAVLVTCDLVEPAMAYIKDPRPAERLRVTRLHALELASDEDLKDGLYDVAQDVVQAVVQAARDAAWYASWNAAQVARDAAQNDVQAARDAAWYAASNAAQAAQDNQERILREWLSNKRTVEQVRERMEAER